MNDVETIAEAIESSAQRHPQQGYVFQDMQGKETYYSFANLRDEIHQCAAYLSSQNLCKGDRVLFCITLPEQFVIAFLACIALGVIPVPIVDQKYRTKPQDLLRLQELILLCKPVAIVCSDNLLNEIFADEATDAHQVKIISASERSTNKVKFPDIQADDIAYLQLTSGTTSFSKAVIATHKSLLANVEGIMGSSGLNMDPQQDKGTCWLPLYHDMGIIGFVISTIVWGVTTIFIPIKRFLRRPASWLDTMHRHRATTTYGPNFAYLLINRLIKDQDLQQWDLSCVTAMGCGAEPMNPKLLQACQQRLSALSRLPISAIKPSYGLAENTLCTTMTPLNESMATLTIKEKLYRDQGIVQISHEKSDSIVVVSCGRPIMNSAIKITDNNGLQLPDARKGEIVVSGPSVSVGYFGNVTETAARFRGGWHFTGDIGFMFDGQLFVTGRKKELIICNGKNYAPHEIEWCIEEIESIRKGAVIAFSIAGEGSEKLCILVGARNNQQSGLKAAIKAAIEVKALGHFGLSVADVIFVLPSQVPKTSAGKLKRTLVRQQYLDGYYQKAEQRKRSGYE